MSADPTPLAVLQRIYLELLLKRAENGGDEAILNRIERVLGLAESDTQLFDRIERTLLSMRPSAGSGAEP